MKNAFKSFTNAVLAMQEQHVKKINGNFEWYYSKIEKHLQAKNVERVILYLRIYYSFHEVEITEARKDFSDAVNFLKENGIRIKVVKDKNGYKQTVFVKLNDGTVTPITQSYYPNGYEHFFADEF